MTIAEKVRSARREMGRGFTQEKLAAAMTAAGSARKGNWVTQLENGRIGTLYPEDIKALAVALSKPESYFSDEPQEKISLGDFATLMRDLRDRVMRLEVEVADLKAHRGSLPIGKVNRVARRKSEEARR